jgi:hypothetical protein
MTSAVRGLRSLDAKNKLVVFMDCGHSMVIDMTVDDPADYDRKCRVVCLECKRVGNDLHEIGGEA